jgi:hypothetical protein
MAKGSKGGRKGGSVGKGSASSRQPRPSRTPGWTTVLPGSMAPAKASKPGGGGGK